MHDAYELAKFFSDASLEEKTDVLLEICKREPDLLLDFIRDNPCDSELRALTAAGKKIDAIKLYRMKTGADLKESKDYVEAL